MSEYLFHPGDLVATLENHRKKLGEEIDNLSEDYVLKVNEAEYIKQKVASETLRPLSIESGVEVVRDHEEQRACQGHFSTFIERVPCLDVSLRFSGDKGLFKMRQNPFSEPPKGRIVGNEIYATFTIERGETPESTRRNIDRWEQRIRSHISDQQPHLDAWNNNLEQLITGRFRATKDRYLKKNELVASIGLPIRRREGDSGTYSVGLPPKRINISTPTQPLTVPPGQYSPHPSVDEQSYQDILGPIRWTGRTMERDPAAYACLHEEHLRTQFLALLNGSFEGQGTGESFSVNGKTDIMLKVKDRPVFIAECKFWDGPAGFNKIIDQLTSYLTWRDSKTAILLFVRNVDVVPVLEQIPQLVASHRLFTKRESTNQAGEFRFVLRNAQDESLPLVVTIMCFHLPETTHRRGK